MDTLTRQKTSRRCCGRELALEIPQRRHGSEQIVAAFPGLNRLDAVSSALRRERQGAWLSAVSLAKLAEHKAARTEDGREPRLPHLFNKGGCMMPKLLRFLIWHLSSGFALGALTALVIAVSFPHALGHDGAIEPVALLLQIYAFGASFALGSLGTALMGKID